MSNTIKKEKEGRRSLKAILIFSIFVFLPSSYGYESCASFADCFDKGNATEDADAQIYYYTQALEKKDASELLFLIPMLYNNRGNAYHHKGLYKRAIADYAKAIELYPEFAEAYLNRGNVYDDMGDHDRAIEDYTKSIKLGNPQPWIPYTNRGTAYASKGEYDKALQDFAKALKIHPEDDLAYNNRGETFFLLNQLEKAIKDYNRSIEITKGEDPTAYANLGDVYFILNDEEKMKENYDKAIEIFKKHFKSLSDWDKQAYAYYLAMASKDLDEAEKIMRELVRKHKESREYLSTLAFVLYKNGKDEEAIKIYNDLEKRSPEAEKANLYYHLAELYEQKYQSTQEDSYLDQAKTYLEKSLSILPTNPFSLKLYKEITGKPYR